MRCLLLAGLLMTASFAVPLPAAEQPNIILIFADDLGYGDLACYGNPKIKTPNIDRLAVEGQRWTNFYASGSTCVPSRTGLMSGRYPGFLGDQPLAQDRTALMPAMLKRQGYTTAILGKWHLAGYPADFTQSPMHPLECGFDYHYGTPGSNDVPPPAGKKQTRDVFDAADKFTFQVPLIRGREIVEYPADQEQFTQRYTAEAVKWIKEQRDRRFFLYMAHNMVHAPIFASPQFQNRSAGGRFGDVVEELDWSVGEVMKTLKELGIDDKTLVVFTSDNGPWTAFGPHGGTAAPLRGEKATAWEGGFRVPCIMHWPGKIKPAVVHDIGANLDFYATFATLAGGTTPADKPGFGSQDLSGCLISGQSSPRTHWCYGSGALAFRSERYKIHLMTQLPTDPIARANTPTTSHDPPLLFDLASDPGEQHNIAQQQPEVVAQVRGELDDFLLRMKPTKQAANAKRAKGKARQVATADPAVVFPAGAQPIMVQETGAGEGPLWVEPIGLLTSGDGHVMLRSKSGEQSVFIENAGTNGLALDPHGQLLMCQSVLKRIVRRDPASGQLTTLTSSYQGHKYNQPNDITLDSKGRVYFTDPQYGPRDHMEMIDDAGRFVEGVYRIDPNGTCTRILAHEVDRPNGLVISADDRYLYVADNNNNTVGGSRKLWRFELSASGDVVPDSGRLLHDWGSTRGPDGMELDQLGRLYVAAGLNRQNAPFETQDKPTAGVYVFSPEGKLLTFVPIPRDECTNVAFGGEDKKTLFVTAGGTLWTIPTLVPGR
jgi:gluconolactonase